MARSSCPAILLGRRLHLVVGERATLSRLPAGQIVGYPCHRTVGVRQGFLDAGNEIRVVHRPGGGAFKEFRGDGQ